MLEKFKAYAVRDPEITAMGIDFSKGFEDSKANPNEEGDVKKEVLKFPTNCYSC